MPDSLRQTFAMETYARRNYNYLNRMVDADNLPYFDIFWTEPAEAAHDWPDFGDVMTRQLQAAVMARRMTGEPVEIERAWYSKTLSYLDPKTGLLVRPSTSFSAPVADLGDMSLTLYALVTAYMDNGDESLRASILRMVDHLGECDASCQTWGFIIKGLMVCARLMDYEPAFHLASGLVKRIFGEAPLFTPDNRFLRGGHMHGNLRSLVGAADYALHAGDPEIFSRVDALYRYVRSTGAGFGFIPEVTERQGDIIACETCALMDYLGLAVTLANHGHPEYWGDVERIARNHAVESQIADTSWLVSDPSREDTEQFSWREIGERMIGGYAGWSSPNHLLATKEVLHWGGPELQGKARAFQNCCGGSGTHGYFIVWKNASRFEDGRLSVNLHIDKLLPQAEIRSFQPYKGLLTIDLKESCAVRIRIPDFVKPGEMTVFVNGAAVPSRIWGNYAELDVLGGGSMIEARYPVPVFDEEVTVGNPGFRQYRYRVTWKGDTVVRMAPIGNDSPFGYSDFDGGEVPAYYGVDGPAPLYQRERLLDDAEPELAPIHMDDGGLDFWKIR